jgi:hypothetical protein
LKAIFIAVLALVCGMPVAESLEQSQVKYRHNTDGFGEYNQQRHPDEAE